MRPPVRLLAVLVLLLAGIGGAFGVTWLLDDRAIEQRGSVTEGVVSEVRERPGRDSVVVRLDKLDGRPVVVTKVGEVRVGERLAVEYDPDGPQVGKVAGTDRDRRDGRLLLVAAAAVMVLAATLTPWRRGPAAGTSDPPTPGARARGRRASGARVRRGRAGGPVAPAPGPPDDPARPSATTS